MEGSAHISESLTAVDHDCLRGLESFSLGQLPAEILGIDPHHHPGHVKSRHLCLCQETAAVKETESVHFPLFLRTARSRQSQERIVLSAAAGTAQAVYRADPHFKLSLLDIALSRPGAGQIDHCKVHI